MGSTRDGARRAPTPPDVIGGGVVVRQPEAPKPPPAPGMGVPVEPDGAALVALLAPTSDANAGTRSLAQSIANAAELARNDIGDASIGLRVYDTRGTEAGAAAAAAQAKADGAAVVLGPLFASSVAAAKPAMVEGGLTGLAFSTDGSVAGGNVFLIGMLVQEEVDRIVSYAAARGMRSMGVLAGETPYGRLAAAAARRSAQANGVTLALEQGYDRTFTGIEAGVTAYSEAHLAQSDLQPIQAVLLADSGQQLQSVGSFLAYFDVTQPDVQYLGVGGWNSDGTRKERSLVGGWFAAPDPRTPQQFAERYQLAFGAEPHPLAALGYDAMAAVGTLRAEARAVGQRFPFTPDAISSPQGFSGVNGAFRFRPDGLNERGLAVLEVRTDGFEIIDPAPSGFVGY